MGNILYTTSDRFYVVTDKGIDEYDSEKIMKYRNTVKSIRRKNEWKTSGAGAKFMNSYVPDDIDDLEIGETRINGVSGSGGDVIYSAVMGEVSGLYRKILHEDTAEGLVTSTRDVQIFRISVRGGDCAVGIGKGLERHIAIVDIETGKYRELTEGEVREDYPCYSRDGGRIFYSSAGLALSPGGVPVGVGAYALCCYHIRRNELSELLASNKFDYIVPREDKEGNLLFIKRPYRDSFNRGSLFRDIILFPVRIVKAIGGLLNAFSILFGGESLRSGRNARDVKAKQMRERDLFFDGNVINAQQMLKQNQRRGEKFPGIIPQSWELTRLDENGEQSCIKKGVMDYVLCDNGDIVYSNGNAVIRMSADGSEQRLEKCSMASNLVEVS